LKNIILNTINIIIVSGLFCLSLFANGEQIAENPQALAIPYDLITESHQSNIIISDDIITIMAEKGTDLYTNSSGSSAIDNAPRIYFTPKADFSLSAKLNANFTSAYDGGALYVYSDSNNWAKLLFERFKSGENGIASTITKNFGDDAYHNLISNNEIYFKIVKKENTFTFYYSTNGEVWLYRRSFNLSSQASIKVGFIAQSPLSKTHQVEYSNIVFNE